MKHLVNFCLLILLASLSFIPKTGAYFSDGTDSRNNLFVAGVWETAVSCEVRLIAPNGGEVYIVASPKDDIEIVWENNFSDTDFDAKSMSYIKLWLSMDGGQKYVPAINGNTKKPNTESFIWKPHPANNDQLKVKITVYDLDDNLLCEDDSDDVFTVVPPSRGNSMVLPKVSKNVVAEELVVEETEIADVEENDEEEPLLGNPEPIEDIPIPIQLPGLEEI